MTLAKTGTQARTDGWWYPWLFVGGFGIVFLVNGVLVWYALTTWTGLETKDHYNEGLAYNDVLDERARQSQLGWQADVAFTPSAYGGQVVFRLNDADGGLDGLDVSGVVLRPIQDGMDQDIAFLAQGGGVYAASIAVPLSGQWELRLQAQRGGDVFKLRQRIQVP